MAAVPWSDDEFKSLMKTAKLCTSVKEVVLKHNALHKTGRSHDSILGIAQRNGVNLSDHFRPTRRAEDHPMPERVKQLVNHIKYHQHATVLDICNALDLSPKRLEDLVIMARASNHSITLSPDNTIALSLEANSVDRLAVHRLPINPIAGHIKFGVASDLHFASKLHRGECLEDFVNIAMQDFGIQNIFCPGDIFAGINMYKGQNNEIDCWGHGQQLALAVRGLPKRDGLQWHACGGNHDESFMKASGADVIDGLGKARQDVKTYGFYSALVDIEVPGAKAPIKVELFHPDKAGAYALTYHMQKAIEQIPGGMKPNILLVGHEHQSLQLPDYRGIAGFLCGCFEDQTLYLKRKHANPAIGGWILDLGVDAKGAWRSLTSTWIRYFHARRGSIPVSDGRMERSVGLPS